MDADLKLLADASLHVAAAEDALGDCAFVTAGERLDHAAAALAELRERWPAMGAAARTVVAPAARDVRDRLDTARQRVPRVAAVTEGAPESDPDDEVEPEAA